MQSVHSDGKEDKTNASSGGLTLTGKLGDVMKESCSIALTFAKSYLQRIDSNNRALRVGHIHIHVPEVFYFSFSLIENLSEIKNSINNGKRKKTNRIHSFVFSLH